MLLENCKIGFAMTGSFCVIDDVLPEMQRLLNEKCKITPIFSETVYNTDTRFFLAKDLIETVKNMTGMLPLHTIEQVEPIGPKNLLDMLVIAPCTGNTIAKMAAGVVDSPVLMAAKAVIRNNRPVVIAVSTNDGLGNNAASLGFLLAKKNFYFVPFGQDNPKDKPNSLVADMTKIADTCMLAMEFRQIQPLLV